MGAGLVGCADLVGADFEHALADTGAPTADPPELPSEAELPNAPDAAHDAAKPKPADAGACCPDGAPTQTPDAAAAEACVGRTFYEDRDGDGYGGNVTTTSCFEPPGFAGIAGDCDDGNPMVHPHRLDASSTPYVVTGTSHSSYDFDCDGVESPAIAIPPCNSASSGWANGAICESTSNLYDICSYAASYSADGGTTLPCGAAVFICRYVSSSYEWVSYGKAACL
jgi:hypothetical protein